MYRKEQKMFSENFISWLLFKLFDGVDNATQNKKHSKAIEKQLCDFFTMKREEFENISYTDEFDFQGFEEYIRNNLVNEAIMFFRGTQQQRNSAEASIISKAINYASAKTSGSQKIVESYIKQSLQIIYNYYVEQIDSVTRINTNMAVDEITQKIDDTTQDIKKQINQISNNETAYLRKLDVLKILEKYELPDYILDMCPEKYDPHNDEISKAEMDVLFKANPNIVTDFLLLLSLISEMNTAVLDMLCFYKGHLEIDSYGSLKNDVWQKILYFENLLSKPYCTDEIEKEFEKYCYNNTYNEYIPEIDEYIEYNYILIRKKMDTIKTSFNEVKSRLIAQITEAIN